MVTLKSLNQPIPVVPREQRRPSDWMVTHTDDVILETLATPDRMVLSPRAIELNQDALTSGRISQRVGTLEEHNFLDRIVDGYYQITDTGVRYLQGRRIVNEIETGNTYSGVYDPKSDEYELFKNGDKWSPSKISVERLSWGDESSESGRAMVVQAILRDVTDEDEFDLSFLITTARRFQLHTQNEWTIDQALLIGHLQRSGPDSR